MNTFGHILRLTTFGESHGTAIGGVVDGYPSGIPIDKAFISQELSRRAPGRSAVSTSRRESDEVEFLSGIYNGLSLGTPIAFIIRNTDVRESDYDAIKHVYRPSHADYTYEAKYGLRDHRGGGRASGRETAVRVVAGALAKLLLKPTGITIQAFTSQIGPISLPELYTQYELEASKTNELCCPDADVAAQMKDFLEQTRMAKDSAGGVVSCVIKHCPAGIGEPIFGKLHATLASAMLSIPSAKGFEIGKGFDLANMTGSQANDVFFADNYGIHTRTNHSGGVQGGISNGEDIYFRVAFKPIPTILRPQETITVQGEPTTIQPSGRHDVCAIPRIVPVVEAMTALTIADAWLQQKIQST